MNPQGKIWIDLDGVDKDKALETAEQVSSCKAVKGFRVGCLIDQEVFRQNGELKLFYELSIVGKPVWADLRLMGDSESVISQAEPYIESGYVQYLSVYAMGGVKTMISLLLEAVKKEVEVIAATELTFLSEKKGKQVDLFDSYSTDDSVISLARLAVSAGIRHLVCSGYKINVLAQRQDLACLRKIVMAVRPEWSFRAEDDRSQAVTPARALAGGADALVIGGAITEDMYPLSAVKKTVDEISAIV